MGGSSGFINNGGSTGCALAKSALSPDFPLTWAGKFFL